MSSQDEQTLQRRANLAELVKLGVDPYPHAFARRQTVSQLVERYDAQDKAALEGERIDAVMEVGPGRTGGFVRIDFDAARTPRGPSVAPLAVAGFAFADRELDLGLGPLASARPVA